ncbi:MAG: hypothetical protein ABIL18_03310 [candidate division WOR-3 bacterium]
MREIEIIKIKPSVLAFITSAFYFFIGILTAVVRLALMSNELIYLKAEHVSGLILYHLLLFPVIGFVCGLLFALIYNLLARWVGGIKITIKEDADRDSVRT